MSNKKKREQAAKQASAPGRVKSSLGISGISSKINWLLVLVLVLPHLISSVVIDPTIAPRYVFLSAFIVAFTLFFYAWKRSPVSLAFPVLLKAVFVLVLGYGAWSLAGLSSAINIQSGIYEVARHLLNILLLFFIIQTVSEERSQVLKLCKALMVVALLQGMVGIIQFYGVGFNELPGANAKPYGLMANRNLFGSAQVLLLPFVLYVLYKASSFWKYIGMSALVITVFSLIISQTRSAWLASGVMFSFSLVFALIFAPSARKKWIVAAVGGVVLTGMLTVFIVASDYKGEVSRSIKERAGSITGVSAVTSNVTSNISDRLTIWQKTFELVKDHPITGVGLGNWKLNIATYTSEGMSWAKGRYLPDRAHNEYLQTAAETGIPGAVMYYGMCLMILIIGFRVIRSSVDEDSRVLVIFMMSGLLAFATDSLFSFPSERIEHSLYIILMAGIILGGYLKRAQGGGVKPTPLNKVWVAAFLLISAGNLYLGFEKINFEKQMHKVRALEEEGRYNEMIEEAERGQTIFVTLDPNATSLEAKTGMAWKELKNYDKAIPAFEKALLIHPNSATINNNLGTIYTEMQQFEKAIVYYERALKLAPEYDIVLKNLAVNYLNTGRYTDCIHVLGKLNIVGDELLNRILEEAKKRQASADSVSK